ncbi:molybdopterin molybdenumtransferase MoeA [Carboxydothermus islandicus]|uniref:Molybdopterin molybdenumtransferase n=1 Tax=Carboxydothermus islandicus TaxID=661089 RepID=A0A1L8D0C2_9THEO|nr:gephyrin-like molybdotransferase Glp [Carboxydothermus islandicus]GAV24577.1 molybdopterin molybdenumtransferase MoeA [Carboxydothermus islandicus]
METNVALEKALNMLLAYVPKPGTEIVEILKSQNRVLAEDVLADIMVPPFSRSPLDGFAFRSSDSPREKGQKVKLKIVDYLPAGVPATRPVNSGEAVKLMTGAMIPEGADAVVKFEDVVEEDGYVIIDFPVKPETNIVKKGEDFIPGDVIIEKDRVINANAISLLALAGKKEVLVYKIPKVYIICTGSELVDIEQIPGPGKIRNTNLYSIGALVVRSGGEPILGQIVNDDLNLIAREIKRGLEVADLVLTTGGASVGEYDLIIKALESIGAEILFWKTDFKPGTPVIGAVANGKIVIGLSGNPQAAMTSFELIAYPVIRKLTGRQNIYHARVKAFLDHPFDKTRGQRRFARGYCYLKEGEFRVKILPWLSPGSLKGVLNSNALVEIPKNCPPLKTNDPVNIVLIEGGSLSAFDTPDSGLF